MNINTLTPNDCIVVTNIDEYDKVKEIFSRIYPPILISGFLPDKSPNAMYIIDRDEKAFSDGWLMDPTIYNLIPASDFIASNS